MTLILQTSAAIASPIFPSLTEIDPDIAMLFRASYLTGLADGAEVNDFTALGQAVERVRHFNGVPSGWAFPHYNVDKGRPSLRFDGNNNITNFPTTGALVSIPQPVTVFATFNTDGFGYSSVSYARILGGGTTTGNAWGFRPTNVAGQFLALTGSTTATVAGGLAAGAWGTMGVVFAGAGSKIITPDGVIHGVTLGDIPLDGIRMGGNSNPAVTNQGFIGDLSEARVYTRAMSDADLLATWQAMGGV